MSGYPSIFNDVIGPVMRGPSSSHCAGALRIGRICRDLMKGQINHASLYIDPNGSLATTHESQGSDMGLMGGLLGWDATDDRLPEAGNHLATNGLSLSIEIRDIAAVHPNTYQLRLDGPQGSCELTALSTGGGMIEIIEIDGKQCTITAGWRQVLDGKFIEHQWAAIDPQGNRLNSGLAMIGQDPTDGKIRSWSAFQK